MVAIPHSAKCQLGQGPTTTNHAYNQACNVPTQHPGNLPPRYNNGQPKRLHAGTGWCPADESHQWVNTNMSNNATTQGCIEQTQTMCELQMNYGITLKKAVPGGANPMHLLNGAPKQHSGYVACIHGSAVGIQTAPQRNYLSHCGRVVPPRYMANSDQ